MEIIKYGKIPPQEKETGTEITCLACSSVLKYFVGDIKIYQNETGSIFHVFCPLCGKIIILSTRYNEP